MWRLTREGERLFERLGDDLRGIELVRTVPTQEVIHLKFVKPEQEIMGRLRGLSCSDCCNRFRCLASRAFAQYTGA